MLLTMFNVMVNNVLVMNIMVNKMFVMNIMVNMMVYFVKMVNLMVNIVNMVYGLMGRVLAKSLVISIGLSNHTRFVTQFDMTTNRNMSVSKTPTNSSKTRQEGSRA